MQDHSAVIASRSIVDWYSFTVNTLDYESGRTVVVVAMTQKSLEHALAGFYDQFGDIAKWERCKSRSPYKIAMTNGLGVTVFCSPTITNVLIEISGRGCEWLGEYLFGLIEITHGKCSRVDLAVDFETEVAPGEFVGNGYSKRFRTNSHVSSATGETEYIGSRKSERYCRVYKYAPPHPRSKYLRIEYVYRKKMAKVIAQKLSEFGVERIVMASHDRYGWKSGLLEGQHEDIDLSRFVPERTNPGTLRWLLVQVVPAFKRLVEEGAIDNPEAFLQKYFLEDGVEDGT